MYRGWSVCTEVRACAAMLECLQQAWSVCSVVGEKNILKSSDPRYRYNFMLRSWWWWWWWRLGVGMAHCDLCMTLDARL